MKTPDWSELDSAYQAACRMLSGAPGAVHLLGIGGVGMAALAVQLHGLGYAVSGCDAQSGRITARLRALGITALVGHSPEHLVGGFQFAVRSPAVRDSEPELLAAQAKGLPVFARGVVLPALLRQRESVAVAGSHGKTTTTAMLTHILRLCGRSVGFAIGGEVDAAGTVGAFSAQGPLVVEADESDGTLALYEAERAILTNVELDHVDYFRSAAELDACFERFVSRTRESVWFCADDEGAARAARGHARAHSFGFGGAADLRAHSVQESGLSISAAVARGGAELGRFALAVPGRTNLLNALGALGVAMELGAPFAEAAAALGSFSGVRRRFERIAEAKGRLVLSDYAHHPTEIRALLDQVRALGGRRVLAVYQPHRYSRTAALAAQFAPAFAGVDELVLAPVYGAFEQPVEGGTSADLFRHFEGSRQSVALAHSLLEAWELIRDKWREGDVLLVIGAGDVEKIAGWAADHLASQPV